MSKCRVTVHDHDPISRIIEGEGFLYRQVRIMSGTLVMVGLRLAGRRQVQQALLSPHCRHLAGPTLPGSFLTLEHVEYNQEDIAVK